MTTTFLCLRARFFSPAYTAVPCRDTGTYSGCCFSQFNSQINPNFGHLTGNIINSALQSTLSPLRSKFSTHTEASFDIIDINNISNILLCGTTHQSRKKVKSFLFTF